MSDQDEKLYNVIVIGGGPAGMMAAIRAAQRGRSVLLLEKNKRLGKKLSITGGGRCNVTNNRPVVREMLSKYKDSGKFLFSTFVQHGVSQSMDWFQVRGVELHEENEGRLFPTTNSAETICQTLETAVTKAGVQVQRGTSVTGVTKAADGQWRVATAAGQTYQAASCVVATGGRSRPETGSTGEGFEWLESLGHTVNQSSLALVPVALQDSWTDRVSGITIPELKLTVRADGIKQTVVTGKVLFTHVGLSGPTVLNLSSTIGQLLQHCPVTIDLNFFPQYDTGTLRTNLHQHLEKTSNQLIRNSLTAWLPRALVAVMLEQAHIDGETVGHSVSSDERKRLVDVLQRLSVKVDRLLGPEKAVISGGGVALDEINFKTMESRIVSGLYLVGDTLDIDRPSGGYSLQLCWSTGWVAGESVGT